MTSIQEKIIKPKLGLLELAKRLGSVSQAYCVMVDNRSRIVPNAIWHKYIAQSLSERKAAGDNFAFLSVHNDFPWVVNGNDTFDPACPKWYARQNDGVQIWRRRF